MTVTDKPTDHHADLRRLLPHQATFARSIG